MSQKIHMPMNASGCFVCNKKDQHGWHILNCHHKVYMMCFYKYINTDTECSCHMAQLSYNFTEQVKTSLGTDSATTGTRRIRE